ncbi:right-handed parallel beta-helix repeat-containing protein [Pseudalkalibacillus sp. R45]|uniref:right-handed parallel beta-helix repeat-containing protein n=1 Tax=Pseudalkalibacillus sp. R45 TaxID=3457433 RepID=UPI003FCCC745
MGISQKSQLLKTAFSSLPFGSVKPTGWLKKQLEIQANGLTGHLDEIWEDVGSESGWLGGDGESWERGPYYLDGLLPLSYLLEDDKLLKKTKTWVESILSSQKHNGQFGPGTNDDWWPRMVILKVLIMYYEVSEDERVIPFMKNYFKYQRAHIEEKPLKEWAAARGAENLLSIYWFYDISPSEWLLELAEIIYQQSIEWSEIFLDFPYKERVTTFNHRTHVVNVAMGLKLPAVYYLQSRNHLHKTAPKKGIDSLMQYHGQSQGMFSGDEWLAGTDPSQGTELCAVVEYMYTLQHLARILGDSEWGDRLEATAYNALPATLKPDHWGHQYDQQVNQVLVSCDQRNWTQNGDESNLFGFEPNFGCCLANMHQGWPKFAANMWMKTDDGFVAIVYGPNQLKTNLENGEMVAIKQKTDYPFRDQIHFGIQLDKKAEFTLRLRIPYWCEEPRIFINGNVAHYEVTDGFAVISREWSDKDSLLLELPMGVKVKKRPSGGVSIERGPLLYGLKIGEDWKKLKGKNPYADWEVYPTTPWNYGLVINKTDTNIALPSYHLKFDAIHDQPFEPLHAPVKLEVPGVQILHWTLKQNSAGPIPSSSDVEYAASDQITLIPYGCTNLRIAEFPVLKEQNLKNKGGIDSLNLVTPTEGMIITENTTFKPGTYEFKNGKGIILANDNIEINGNGAVIVGPGVKGRKYSYRGTGIFSSGHSNIILNNLTIKGFKLGCKFMFAENIVIKDNDFSYNFTDPEHGWGDGDPDGALMLEHVNNSIIKGNTGNNVWNGLNLHYSNNNVVENNQFSHCTNVCLKLWNASKNKISNNTMSHGIRISPGEVHARDSTSVLIETASNDNQFYNNDFTYGGDGVFIRSLNGAISTGNYFEGNDASYAHNNAWEVWDTGNTFIRNKGNHSSYGFWLGGSDHTIFIENEAAYNGLEKSNAPEAFGNAGVAVVNGSSSHFIMKDNYIHDNKSCGVAIRFKEGYESYHWIIQGNRFTNNETYGIYLKNVNWIDIAGNEFADNQKGNIKIDENVTNLFQRECDIDTEEPKIRVSLSTEVAKVGEWIKFDSSQSNSSSPLPLQYRWDLGDGTIHTTPTFNHQYKEPGFYRVGVTVHNQAKAALEWFDVYVLSDETFAINDLRKWSTVTHEPDQFVSVKEDKLNRLSDESSIHFKSTSKLATFKFSAEKPIHCKESVSFWVKFHHETRDGFIPQQSPIIRLVDGNQNAYEYLPQSFTFDWSKMRSESRNGWTLITIPAGGNSEWIIHENGRMNLENIQSIEFSIHSKGGYYSFWIDGFSIH